MKFFILLLSLSFFLSCQEDTQVNTISGRIFSDCQTPFPNRELALKVNVGGSFQNPFIIGSTISESDGTFRLSYELKSEQRGSADLLLIRNNGFETLLERISLNQSILANLFVKNESLIFISFLSNQALRANDTLFYSIDGGTKDYFKVNPSNGSIDTLKVPVPNQVEGLFSATFFYGLGQREFNLAKEALTIPDSVFQHLPLNLFGCGDTLNVPLFLNN